MLGDAFISNNSGEILTYTSLTKDTMIDTILSNKSSIAQMFQSDTFNKEDINTFTLDGNKILMGFETLRNGMKIAVASPEKATKKDLYAMVGKSGIVTLILNLLTIILAFTISKSITKPLIKTSDMLQEMEYNIE